MADLGDTLVSHQEVRRLEHQKTWKDTYFNAMAKGVPEDKARRLANAVALSWKPRRKRT